VEKTATMMIRNVLILFIVNIFYCLLPIIALKLEMVRERGDNRENADLLERISGLSIHIILFCKIEERIMMIIDIVDADLEDALTVVFLVRPDELHSDVQMVERLHAEVVFLPVVLYKTIKG
jgi:hypothetical protein